MRMEVHSTKHFWSILRRLENWRDNFMVDDYTYGPDEFNSIVKMQMNKNIEALLSFWARQLYRDYFELPHPELAGIKSFAFCNKQIGMANFVFMTCGDENNAWIFGQCEGFIDIVITRTHIYHTSRSNKSPILSNLKKLSDVDLPKSSKPSPYGILLSQTRPYHFFYDQLKNFLSFPTNNRPVSVKDAFFIPDAVNVNECCGVYVYPTTIGNNQLRGGAAKRMNEKMEIRIFEEVCCHPSARPLMDNKLILWCGITGQKRMWVEQVDGIVNIVRTMSGTFSDIEVIIDGMTAREGKYIENKEDEEIFWNIANRLGETHRVKSMIGRSYREKVAVCRDVDAFIANAGTGAIVPLRICRKPGVLHSNTRLDAFRDKYTHPVKRVEKNFVQDIVTGDNQRPDFLSYSIRWEHIYNLLVEVLNETRKTSVPLLDTRE